MNLLELHYYLDDNSHSMNAIVKNKSEAELIKLFFEVSNLLDLDITLEFEALKEGGIKDIIKYFKKKKNKQALMIFFGTIISNVLINITSDYFIKDKELEELNKEEKRLNILKLKNDLQQDSLTKEQETVILENIVIQISETHKIKVFKSRFYQQILKESKLYQFSTTELDTNYKPLSVEKSILREHFSKHVLESEDLKPKTIENANIEIVSPVLKQGNIKWKGLYNDKPISFNLLDSEFKNAVLNKQYSFSNGTSITCSLEIVVTLDNKGEEIIKEASVSDVIEVFDGTQIIITKKAKHLKESKNQIKIDFKE
ncbi:hypothetical protein SAMN04515674_11814 [Pseudarcicella hirudinis]|uniref:Uncharacterized protein n=1 Tax=Pseudarcicella hirudinis TaxID=1079859 RepID=A0A1I5YCP0_9BACT|nr:hypothetical protein [Pseudarcicella hirudinis]SFQ41933.1 hypothetical protein SAMN04515674_11814 [Pseudarcicella hirudinis]